MLVEGGRLKQKPNLSFPNVFFVLRKDHGCPLSDDGSLTEWAAEMFHISLCSSMKQNNSSQRDVTVVTTLFHSTSVRFSV